MNAAIRKDRKRKVFYMRKVNQDLFLANLKSGDIGLICSKSLFSTLQNWYRKRFKEGELRASHGFYLNNPPELTEANNILLSKATINKNIGDKTKCWIFRYTKLTHEGLEAMNAAADMAISVGGHYSVEGIWQFAKSFFTKKMNMKDKKGVFCTEFTSDIILKGIPAKDYIQDRKPWQIDPSYQLNWFSIDGKLKNWELIGFYDGEGSFFIA